MTPGEAAGRGGAIGELVRLFGWLGIVGFGGPSAHIALIEDEAVRKRDWMSREEYAQALAATNILPGPNSTEMAIHVGYRRAGWRGGTAAGVAFIAPAFLMMIALSWAYFRWSNVAAIADLFEGLAPAVIAVIAITLWRLFRSSVKDVAQLVLMVAAGAMAFAFTAWEPLILIGAGLVGVALYLPGRAFPAWPLLSLAPWPIMAVALFTWQPDVLWDLASVFLRAGGLLFGGGYVLIPLIEDDVVDRFGWLTSQQFLDGVALGQATPGPIVITATFVGYGAAGLPGALVATVCVFVPSFVFAIGAGRFLDRVRNWQPAVAFLKGVSPAVVGSIAAVAVKLARDAIDDAWAIPLFVAALLIAWRYGPLPAMAAAGSAGVAIGWAGR